jgi:hypothetical protein
MQQLANPPPPRSSCLQRLGGRRQKKGEDPQGLREIDEIEHSHGENVEGGGGKALVEEHDAENGDVEGEVANKRGAEQFDAALDLADAGGGLLEEGGTPGGRATARRGPEERSEERPGRVTTRWVR